MLQLVHDIHLVAYLLAKGFKQTGPPTYQDGQINFIFDDPNGEIAASIPKFYLKNAPVDAQTYSDYLHSVKSQLIMLKRNARAGGGSND